MKRLVLVLAVVMGAALACDEPVQPPMRGTIVIGFSPEPSAAPNRAVPLGNERLPEDLPRGAREPTVRATGNEVPPPGFQAMSHLTAAHIVLVGQSPRDTVVTLGATGSQARFDSLLVGNYTVKVEGLVNDTVDSYGEATATVEGGKTNTVDLASSSAAFPFASLRPEMRTITSPTTAFALTVRYAAVPTATGYTVQWSPSAGFATGVQSKSLNDTLTTITVSDTGRYYVRARATVSKTTNPRWSDTVSARVVASSIGGGDAGNGTVVRSGVGAVDTTFTALNLLPLSESDWFTVDACREDVIHLETRAARLTPASPLNTLLRLFRGNGTTLVKANDNLDGTTTDSRIDTTLTADDAFKVEVTQANNTFGHYELNVKVTPGPQNTGTGCVPPGPAKVEVTPDTVRFTALGDTARLAAEAKDAINRTLSGITFTWTSRNTAVVSVDGSGKLTAAGNGSVWVLAQTSGLSDSTLVIVGQTPSLSQSTLTVSAASVAAGSVVTLKLIVKDSLGVRLQGGGLTVAFANTGGTSTGAIGALADSGNGAYTAPFTGQVAGTATTIGATIGGSAVVSTAPTVTVTPGSTKKLAFQVQPGGATAGQNIAPVIQVIAQDSFNNQVPTVTGTVTMTIGANLASGTLFGTPSRSFITGVASFPDLWIDRAGNNYTLKAKHSSLDSAFSATFNITEGAPKNLVFTVQPTNAGSGANITPPIQVAIQDSAGNTVTAATNVVTLALLANPGPSTLSGQLIDTAVAGIATFDNLNLDKIASGYTLRATSPGLTSDTSVTFNITAGPAARLGFTVEPSNTTAGGAITPAIQVTVYDGGGNVTTLTDTVTLAILNNAGGGTLSGTVKRVPASGVATFTGLSINKLGTGYTLRATSGSLQSDTSAAFNISAAAPHHLAFGVQPSVTASGDVITPNPTVVIRDLYNNYVAGATNVVNVAIGTNPAGGNLSGDQSNPAVDGTATFNDLRIDAAGVGYRLSAKSAGLDSAVSDTFRIIASLAPSRSVSTAVASPSAGVRVLADTATISVTIRDAGGNPIQAKAVQVASDGSNNFISHLDGASSITDAGGVATATITSTTAQLKTLTVTVDSSGTPIPLDQQPTVAFIADSSAIDSSASTASANPDTVFADGVQQSTITVTVQDTLGNLVSGRTVQLTSSGTGNFIQPGPTNAGGVTTGTISRSTIGRDTIRVKVNPGQTDSVVLVQRPIVDFIGDTISLDVDSAIVTILYSGSTGGDTAIADGVDPVSIQVTIRDTQGNPIQGDSVSFSLSGGGNTITQPVTATDVNGQTVGSVRSTVAQIKSLTITVKQPNGLGGFNTRVMSAHPEVRFKADAPVGLAFRVQPGTSAAGGSITPSVQVAVVDANDNTVLDDTREIHIRLATHTDTTLFGDTLVNAVAGVATFNDLSLQAAATGYQLTAWELMLDSAVSDPFSIIAASPAQIGFQVQPSNVAAGSSISPAVQVRVMDVYGNPAISATNAITLAIAATPDTSAALSGTKTRNAVAGTGVATFDNLSINKKGTGYTLGATAGGLNGDTSTAFNVTAALASRVRFTVQPTSDTAGSAISAVQVTVQDVFGNTVDTNAAVTVSIANDPSGGIAVLSGTTTQAAVSGIATFNDLSINKSGVGYSLRATGTSLTQDFSSSFNIAAAAASQLAFTVQPTVVTAGVAISPAVRVTARDPYGNTATSFTDSVTVALADTATSGAALSGTKKVAAASGVAIFSTLSVDKVGTGYTLAATSGALTPDTSNAFNINVAGAAKVAFVQQPSATVAGAYVSPAVTVAIQDQFGNTLTGASNAVTLSILDNPASGTLLGQTTRSAQNGIATFDSITVDKAASGYTLLAQATSLASDTSDGFNVTAGDPAAATSGVSASPANVIADGSQTAAIAVVVRDSLGNPVPGQTVTLASSGSNNTIVDPGSPTDGSGLATGTIASTTAEAKTISATVGGALVLDSTASITFVADTTNVSASVSTVTADPGPIEANGSATSTITVTVRDPGGNPIAGKTVLIEVTGNNNTVTQPAGPTDGGGVATGSLASTTAQTDTVKVTVDGKLFDQKPTVLFVAGPPAQLGFVVQPTSVAAGVATIAPVVEIAIQDAQGNTVDTASSAVSLTLSGGTAGANLRSTMPVVAVNGIATFDTLRVDSAGTGFQLQATAAGLADGLSDPFDVNPGPVYTISVTPGADTLWTLGDTQQLAAEGRDSVGNVVPDAVFTWSSANEPVMMVDPSTGLVTAVARGLADVTAHSNGKIGTANMAVGVRLGGVGNSFSSALGEIFSSGDLPGTFTALTPGEFNAFATASDLRGQFDVLLFGRDSDGSVNAAWAGRLQDYLALGGGIVFEDPANIGELSPVLTGAAHDTSGGLLTLAVPNLSTGVASAFAGSHITFSAWPDSLAHFLVQGDSAIGLYGRIENGCLVATGTAQGTDGVRGGTATQQNQYALLLNEVRFAADCPLNASPGPTETVRVLPRGLTFVNSALTATPRATALDSVGTPIPGALITWSGLNDTVATVNSGTGEVTSAVSGQVAIMAQGSGADYALATVSVPVGTELNAWGAEVGSGVLGGSFFFGSWGTSPSDRFLVGCDGIRHHDGVAWDTMPATISGCLWGVWGASSSDVYAVGEAGSFLHYDGGNWTPVSLPSGYEYRYYYDVWGTAPNDVFAVGGDAILHYDGVSWQPMANPFGGNDMYGVWGTSSSNVYVVGTGGILHYDGVSWTPQANPSGATLFRLWGTGPNDIFGVGFSGDNVHFDGTSWSAQSYPGGPTYLYDVWGTSPTEVFAVGYGGFILKYNGSAWTRMASPTSNYILTLWRSSSGQFWAAGQSAEVWHGVRGAVPASVEVTPSGATVVSIGANVNFGGLVYDASRNLITPTGPFAWTSENTAVATVAPSTGVATAQTSGQAAIAATYASLTGYGVMTVAATGSPAVDAFANMITPAAVGMLDVWGSSSTSAVAVGNSGSIWRYNGTDWTADPQSGAVTTDQLLSVSGTSDNDIHAVGVNGALLHYSSGMWTVQANPLGSVLHYQVWAATPTAAFTITNTGYVMRWDGTVWDTLPRATTNFLVSVWASSPTDVWAVGNSGTIVRWDGTQWNTVTHSLGTEPMRGVWGTSPNNVYVSTNVGNVLQCNASSCATLPSPGLGYLWEIWGTSPNEVFVLSNSGAIARWNGGGWSTVYSGYGSALRGMWGTSSGTVFAAGGNTAQPVLRGARGAPVQTYGYDTPFGFANYGWWSPGDLGALQVTTTDTLVITHLGLHVHTAGTTVKMALYTDAAGAPGNLITTGEGSVASTGAQEIAVTRVTVLPGTYWIATNFLNATYIQANTASSITYKYRSGYGYANPMPNPFGAPLTTTYSTLNYYLKGFRF